MLNEMYESDENIEILFLGSSHTYRSYNPYMVTKMCGAKAFNAGSSSQLLDGSYFMLKEVAKTNDIDTVYLDTYFSVLNSKSSKNDWSVYLLTDYAKQSMDKFLYLWNSGGVESLLDGYITVRRNYKNRNFINNLNSRKSEVGDYSTITYENEAYLGDGFVYSYEVIDGAKVDFSRNIDLSGDRPTSDFADKWLIKIVDFCKEKGINLVFVDQPMPKELLNNVKGYDNYVEYMYKFSMMHNIPYMNFNCYKNGLDLGLENFKDTDHLNGTGAMKYTEVFCDTVNQIKAGMEIEDLFYTEYLIGE